VGLKPLHEDQFETWFGRLLLDWVDSATQSFLQADIRPQEALVNHQHCVTYVLTAPGKSFSVNFQPSPFNKFPPTAFLLDSPHSFLLKSV
jgi:hypothetical protein